MSKLIEAIDSAKASRRITQKEMQANFGISSQNLATWRGGGTPSDQAYAGLSLLLGISEQEVAVLVEEHQKESGRAPSVRKVNRTMPASGRAVAMDSHRISQAVPITATSAFGRNSYTFSERTIETAVPGAQVSGILSAYAIRISGPQLQPVLLPGSVAWVNPEMPAREGNAVVVRMNDDTGTVGIFVAYEDDSLVIRELNPERRISIPLTDIQGVHTIVLSERI